MASGILGNFDLLENIPQSIYVCPVDDVTSVVLNVVNRRTTHARVTVAITESPNVIVDTDAYVEIETEIPPKGVMERTQILVPSGKYLTLKSSDKFVNAVAWGVENGLELESPPGAIPVSATSLVSNGLFDTDLTGWTKTDVTGLGFATPIDGQVAITNSTGITTFEQTITVVPGRLYYYRFDVTEITGGAAFTINELGGAIVTVNPSQVRTYQGSFIPETTSVSLIFTCNVGSITIDNLVVWDVSEIIHNNIRLLHTIDNPNAFGTNEIDRFGNSVSISGNRAIIGARLEDDAGGTTSGKAYIFDVATGNLLHTLDNPNAYGTSQDDGFGDSVGISGNRAIVGASGEDDAGGTTSGKAYIFDVTNGSLVHTLNNPNAYDTSANDYFGRHVAISGNRAIVGASSEDDAGGSNSGKAYIFDVTTGSLLHTLNNPNAYGISLGDGFGAAVAINGNRAIVSAYLEDDTGDTGGVNNTNSGKVYIFDVTTGSLLHTLDNPNAYDTSTNDYFGQDVAISETHAVVGAPNEDTNSGKAYIFDITDGSLLHTLDNPTSSGPGSRYFGNSVAISGNLAVVGSVEQAGVFQNTTGQANVFDVLTGNLLYTLDDPNPAGTEQFGYSFSPSGQGVAISGLKVLVGARGENFGLPGSGKAYIFEAY